jgi:hypothetical protein
MADPKVPDAAAAERPSGQVVDRQGTATIVFQCPNGHRISVPARLAGKRGACSKCGTAVVIPPATAPAVVPAMPSVSPTAESLVAGDDPVAGDEGTITLQSPPPWIPPTAPRAVPDVHPAASAASPRVPGTGPAADEPRSPAHPAAGLAGMLPVVSGAENATALLVARLWAERDHGGVVELHLVGGSVILPEWYEPRWSLGTHGLFASQAADGSVTLTAVSWESVQKVVVRQVEGLPDGMFE